MIYMLNSTQEVNTGAGGINKRETLNYREAFLNY